MNTKNNIPIKRIRRNILDLKNNYPEEFGCFIMALDSLIKSDDWERICGIHGLSFNPFDKKILCPTNPYTVSQITGIGEPQYCPHGVKHFLIWHTIFLIEFEFLLNKYNQSIKSNNFISLPWLNVAMIGDDINGSYDFLSSTNITILFDSNTITIPNPLVAGKIHKNYNEQKTKRNGYLKTKTTTQRNKMKEIQVQLNNSLLITNYESLSSTDIPKKRTTITNTTPLEIPHNSCHTAIGGSGGSMSSISTAAHDPIFWLHHCNIDRYFYNWMVRITKNFTIKLTTKEILPETLVLILAPFFTNQITMLMTDNFTNYKFCFYNDTKTYLKISDVIDLSQYNYTYEPIALVQKLMWKPHFLELVGIPIPRESCDIKLYIVPKHIDLYKLDLEEREEYLAGSTCWIGINRNTIHCERCEKTRTNITIDITYYLLEKSIGKKNISEYNLILEAVGLSIENPDGTFNKYTQEQILYDGKYYLILDTDDIISNREFKFLPKYIHTKLVQGIIHKLNDLGYTINDFTNWDEIIIVVKKFESDWGINFKDLIKMKIIDKLIPNENTNGTDLVSVDNVVLLKKLFINSIGSNEQVNINYITNGFDEQMNIQILNCINEWVEQFKTQSVNVEFILVNTIGENDIGIEFNFVPIDGEYGTCGDCSLVKSNIIKIDIDSQENYQSIFGLFEFVVKHELGHAFGLTHSYDPKSIMHPFISDLYKKVSVQDIFNILHILN
jgi:predicted Zn-dependent protease